MAQLPREVWDVQPHEYCGPIRTGMTIDEVSSLFGPGEATPYGGQTRFWDLPDPDGSTRKNILHCEFLEDGKVCKVEHRTVRLQSWTWSLRWRYKGIDLCGSSSRLTAKLEKLGVPVTWSLLGGWDTDSGLAYWSEYPNKTVWSVVVYLDRRSAE